MLTDRGYDVRQATGGIGALAQIAADPPDVVDGYSVCGWLRPGEATRDIVVVMLTVRSDVGQRIEGLHVGADDYVPKPFDPDALEARMFAGLLTRPARLEPRSRNSDLEA